jgi:hypothetical protein
MGIAALSADVADAEAPIRLAPAIHLSEPRGGLG